MLASTAALLVQATAASALALRRDAPRRARWAGASLVAESLLLIVGLEAGAQSALFAIAVGIGVVVAVVGRALLSMHAYRSRGLFGAAVALLVLADLAALLVSAQLVVALFVRALAVLGLAIGVQPSLPEASTTPDQSSSKEASARSASRSPGPEQGDRHEEPNEREAFEAATRALGHEMTSLVSALCGYAELIGTTPDLPRPVAKYGDSIFDAAERIGLIAQKMVALGDRGRVVRERVDVLAAIERAVARIEPRVAGTHTIRVEADADVGRAFGATAQFVRSVYYLLENACEATPDGGELRIRASSREGGGPGPSDPRGESAAGTVDIDVIDEGAGMNAELLATAFRPFFTTHRSGCGHPGLGLTAAHNLVRSMGGALRLESRPGEGTSARISLAAAPEVSPAPETKAVKAHPFGGVLLLDDDPLIRSLCVDALGRRGFRVFSSEDGSSARALFEQMPERFALAVLDEQVPGESGSSLARSFLQASAGIRVLLISGMPFPADQSDLEHDRLAVLHKPFGLAEFLAAVDRLLPAPAPTPK